MGKAPIEWVDVERGTRVVRDGSRAENFEGRVLTRRGTTSYPIVDYGFGPQRLKKLWIVIAGQNSDDFNLIGAVSKEDHMSTKCSCLDVCTQLYLASPISG